MALTVKSRRERSASIESLKSDVGLAGVGRVGLGPVGGDLVGALAPLGPDRAEPLALHPHGVGPRTHDGFDGVGVGIGGEVQVLGVAQTVQERVAHDAADQIEAESSRREPLGQRARLGDQGKEALGNHGERGYWSDR